jgi:hydrogenase expression/formation protein HypE
LRGSNGKLPIGKLDPDILNYFISRSRVSPDPQVVQGPRLGEDAAIIDLGCCDLVVHSDPITEASANAGWLAINVAANDVAASGACPRWASITVLLPEGADTNLIDTLSKQIGEAATKLGIDIVGGHTEIAPRLSRPIIVTTVIGITCRGCSIRTSGAQPGDKIIIIGYAGLEGTSIIAVDFRMLLLKCNLKEKLIEEAVRLSKNVSIVEQACSLASRRLVNSMHDATEGGVVGALLEMALASGNTFQVLAEKIPVHPATRVISKCLNIDPFRLISSGTLLATATPGKAERAVSLLRSMGYTAEVIGEVIPGEPKVILHYPGETIEYKSPPRDEIYRVWTFG